MIAGSPARILVADGDAELLELMVPVLRLAGHRITAARDGVQALGLWRNQRVDLVVLDLLLPRLTGLEVLVAALQGYVFTILTCMYLNDALHLH